MFILIPRVRPFRRPVGAHVKHNVPGNHRAAPEKARQTRGRQAPHKGDKQKQSGDAGDESGDDEQHGGQHEHHAFRHGLVRVKPFVQPLLHVAQHADSLDAGDVQPHHGTQDNKNQGGERADMAAHLDDDPQFGHSQNEKNKQGQYAPLSLMMNGCRKARRDGAPFRLCTLNRY